MWRIWTEIYENGELVGSMVSCQVYQRKANAERAARRLYDREEGAAVTYRSIVAEESPWQDRDQNTKEEM